MRLGELPLLAESLRRLDESQWIDQVVVVAPPGWVEPAILLAEELGCSKCAACIEGGATRSESVRLGLAEVGPDATAVLVHDAARPLVSEFVIQRVLTALGEGWDGAVPALPIPDTIKRVERERVVETVERGDLVAVQTPQAFVADVLRRAVAGGDATDCSSLVERAGGRIRWVQGDTRLLKVTTPSDLELVSSWL